MTPKVLPYQSIYGKKKQKQTDKSVIIKLQIMKKAQAYNGGRKIAADYVTKVKVCILKHA